MNSTPRVVLAHDWLTGMRGGERVLEELCRLFPGAPLLTLLHVPGSVSPLIEDREIRASFLDQVPGIGRSYRRFLPLMPAAVRALRVPPCDLLLSSSHCAIKALRPPDGARHLCYVHAPMRYVWGQSGAYFGPGRADPLTRAAAAVLLPWLRRWDAGSNGGVDHFVSNSEHVADQVRSLYRRNASVVHPPVDLARFQLSQPPPGTPAPDSPYLMLTAFAPYKGIEVAIDAFRRLGRPLEIAGGGQLYRRLLPRFGGAVRALGPLTDDQVAAAYRRCRAFVMPAEEDFGITALEAQASGRPVIALDKGGARETVVPLGQDQPTGVLYAGGEDPVEDLVGAVKSYEASASALAPAAARANAERFSPEAFRRGIQTEVERVLRLPPGAPASAPESPRSSS
jgi:glycosyltransferase involved in cell wall biosynthesis